MAWLQLHLAADDARVEPLQALLENLGAVAVSMTDAADQPLFEPPPGETPLWKNTIVTALFEQDTDRELLLASLRGAFADDMPAHRFEVLEDQPWERAWMDSFHPMQFGQRLWIVPSWTPAPDPDAVNLSLDPGLAFGTGTHETTALCLEWLDGAELKDRTVMDFGCGSGVLAIAALLLGARHAWACDIDPQALLATQANAEHNGVAERLTCMLARDVPADLQCDLVLANILAGPLVELQPQLSRLCRTPGQLVLSGILATQADDICRAYQQDFRLNPVAQRNDWIRVSGDKYNADH